MPSFLILDLFLMKNIPIKINFTLLYIAILIPYFIGLFLPLMEADSAQHATMAMRMYYKNDFLNIIKLHQPYLDKPHMHFWLAALSFKFFGVSEVAYRLPAFLFLLLATYSTFNLGKLLYNKFVGHISALIFLASQTIILSAHDVRTDAVLTGAIIFSIWKITSFIKTQKRLDILLGAIFLGVAFSTKGLIAVMVVTFCVLSYLLYNRKWKNLFNIKFLAIGIPFFILSISPVLYAYYHQYDLHPELVVNGQKNVSGVKFILWNQVFNRLNAVGFEETSPNYFFFFHSLLWTFLPFSILAYIAIFTKVKQLIKIRFKKAKGIEFLTLGGILLTLLTISFSKYKLPHYLNILIPILSILTASYLFQKRNNIKTLKISLTIQYIVAIALFLASILLSFFVFKITNYLTLVISGITLLYILFRIIKAKQIFSKILLVSILIIAWANLNLNMFFYPKLSNYQGGKQLAEVVKKENIPLDKIYILPSDFSWSFDFYTKQNTPVFLKENLKNKAYKNTWVVFYEDVYKDLLSEKITFQKIYTVNHYRVDLLKIDFLNKATRPQALTKMYIAQL